MKKIAAAIALVVSSVAAPHAAASVFRFEVESIACYDPQNSCLESSAWTTRLESVRIWLAAPEANISVTTYGWATGDVPITSYSNQSVNDVYTGAFGATLDKYYERCLSYVRCEISGAFKGIWTLDEGFLRVASYDSDLLMDADADGLWTGWITSDRGPTPYPVEFSGRWFAIPEPSPVALIGAGLAGLMFMRRRTRHS